MSERAIAAAGQELANAVGELLAMLDAYRHEGKINPRAGSSNILSMQDARVAKENWCAALAAAQRVATDEYAPEFVEQILQLEAMPPEATFNNADDMLKWLDEDTAAAQRVEAPDTSYAEVSTEQIRRMNEHAAAQRAAEETQIGELLRVIEKRDREHNLFDCPSGGWIRQQLKAALALSPGKASATDSRRLLYGRCPALPVATGRPMKMFPILFSYHRMRDEITELRDVGCMSMMIALPWPMLAAHEAQAQKNHSQSIERLAERGGLSACEACAVLEDRPYHRMTPVEANDALKQHFIEWEPPAE